MIKLLLLSFVTLPIQNHNYNNIIPTVATIFSMLPIIFRNNQPCQNEDDCPYIMKCCQIGDNKFCCTPNNYIKLEYAYVKEIIK